LKNINHHQSYINGTDCHQNMSGQVQTIIRQIFYSK